MKEPKEYLDETFRETGYDDFDKVQPHRARKKLSSIFSPNILNELKN